MDINAIMAELAQYIRIQEEAAATVEALKKELPEIAARYTKTTETRRFTFA